LQQFIYNKKSITIKKYIKRRRKKEKRNNNTCIYNLFNIYAILTLLYILFRILATTIAK